MGIPVFPPRFDTDHMRPFYEGLEKGELRMTACSDCGKWYWYPPEVSPCHPKAHVEWRPVSSNGVVYSYTEVERSLLPGDHKAETPYTILLVEPENVPNARVPSLFVNAGDTQPVCGMRVKLSPVRSGDYMLPAFRTRRVTATPPAPSATGPNMSKYDPGTSTPWYRWYVVFVLGLVYAVNVMDRSLLTILQQPIKEELHLSDAQLGSLTGLAFAAFYATLAIPIARFADRSNRVFVLTASLALWSLLTAGCGMAMGFVTLLLFRMGVGVGEAGGYPPSASVLSDYFTKTRRATALALFGLGAPIGNTLGLFAGGTLNDLVGWRGAFYIIGGLGVLLAPIVLFTVREPRRGVSDDATDDAGGGGGASIWKVSLVLWRLKTIRYLYIGNMCHGFVLYAYGAWSPPYYARTFAMPMGEVASWLSLLSILGAFGTFTGGFMADKLSRFDVRWSMWILAIGAAIFTPVAIAQFLAPVASTSLMIAIVPSFLLMLFVAPTIATGQTLVQPQMRATTAAIMLMLYNIFGLGLGPLLVGVMSDLFQEKLGLGALGLRYAIIVGILLEAVAVIFYVIAARHLKTDLARDRTLDFGTAPAASSPRPA